MTAQKKPGPKRKPPIREEDIQGFKYLDAFFKTMNYPAASYGVSKHL